MYIPAELPRLELQPPPELRPRQGRTGRKTDDSPNPPSRKQLGYNNKKGFIRRVVFSDCTASP
ncbi:hypothetical protein EYF80_049289 [Liparis tanakae]|uniref:Uncharacterized protein n=1 Tax=Liparis tanakae TaxID=230148 RepID=A0A4Z2FI01_9TELE|nr:hypothetical protein EYF80_049289 [Liparis tanakae]